MVLMLMLTFGFVLILMLMMMLMLMFTLMLIAILVLALQGLTPVLLHLLRGSSRSWPTAQHLLGFTPCVPLLLSRQIRLDFSQRFSESFVVEAIDLHLFW